MGALQSLATLGLAETLSAQPLQHAIKTFQDTRALHSASQHLALTVKGKAHRRVQGQARLQLWQEERDVHDCH